MSRRWPILIATLLPLALTTMARADLPRPPWAPSALEQRMEAEGRARTAAHTVPFVVEFDQEAKQPRLIVPRQRLDRLHALLGTPSGNPRPMLPLALGGTALSLWTAFLADYPLTRDVYFTVALLHVLAEAPFLLRAL